MYASPRQDFRFSQKQSMQVKEDSEQLLDLRRETGLSPPVKYFTDRFKAVLLLWIFYVFVLS